MMLMNNKNKSNKIVNNINSLNIFNSILSASDINLKTYSTKDSINLNEETNLVKDEKSTDEMNYNME